MAELIFYALCQLLVATLLLLYGNAHLDITCHAAILISNAISIPDGSIFADLKRADRKKKSDSDYKNGALNLSQY